MEFKIGIDLAKWKTGLAIIEGDKLIYTEECNVYAVEDTEQYERTRYYENCYQFVTKIAGELYNYTNIYDQNHTILVGIEVSNFGNGKNTADYSYWAGIITALLVEKLCRNNINLSIKCFNHDEWYRFVGNCVMNGHRPDKREISKQKSIEYAKIHNDQYWNINNDNIADSINIATFVNKCLDSYDREQLTKLKKLLKRAKSKAKKEYLQGEINKYEKSI